MTQNTQTTAERMAALAHDVWARWMAYMFSKATNQADGSIVIPPDLVQRWGRQARTLYPHLPESEKQSDKDIAAEYLGCAEIDALTAELAQRTLERDAAQETLGMVGRMAKANLDAKDATVAGLTAERDEAQRLIGIYSTSRDAVIAQLGEMNDALRAEVDRLTHGLALTSAVAAGKPIQYVGPLEGMKESLEASYRGALDESARQMGQMKQMMADNAQANQWLVNGVAKIERLEKERDEARAEVERLRPLADAWEAREAQRIAFETFDRDPTPGNHDALTDANMAMLGTGLRARAVRGAKP